MLGIGRIGLLMSKERNALGLVILRTIIYPIYNSLSLRIDVKYIPMEEHFKLFTKENYFKFSKREKVAK